jgi:hypothetical protein
VSGEREGAGCLDRDRRQCDLVDALRREREADDRSPVARDLEAPTWEDVAARGGAHGRRRRLGGTSRRRGGGRFRRGCRRRLRLGPGSRLSPLLRFRRCDDRRTRRSRRLRRRRRRGLRRRGVSCRRLDRRCRRPRKNRPGDEEAAAEDDECAQEDHDGTADGQTPPGRGLGRGWSYIGRGGRRRCRLGGRLLGGRSPGRRSIGGRRRGWGPRRQHGCLSGGRRRPAVALLRQRVLPELRRNENELWAQRQFTVGPDHWSAFFVQNRNSCVEPTMFACRLGLVPHPRSPRSSWRCSPSAVAAKCVRDVSPPYGVFPERRRKVEFETGVDDTPLMDVTQ